MIHYYHKRTQLTTNFIELLKNKITELRTDLWGSLLLEETFPLLLLVLFLLKVWQDMLLQNLFCTPCTQVWNMAPFCSPPGVAAPLTEMVAMSKMNECGVFFNRRRVFRKSEFNKLKVRRVFSVSANYHEHFLSENLATYLWQWFREKIPQKYAVIR